MIACVAFVVLIVMLKSTLFFGIKSTCICFVGTQYLPTVSRRYKCLNCRKVSNLSLKDPF